MGRADLRTLWLMEHTPPPSRAYCVALPGVPLGDPGGCCCIDGRGLCLPQRTIEGAVHCNAKRTRPSSGHGPPPQKECIPGTQSDRCRALWGPRLHSTAPGPVVRPPTSDVARPGRDGGCDAVRRVMRRLWAADGPPPPPTRLHLPSSPPPPPSVAVHRRRRGCPPPPAPPPPPLLMFEADNQNFASAPSVPRGSTLQKVLARLRRGPQGDPGRRGDPSQPPPPLLLHPVVDWHVAPSQGPMAYVGTVTSPRRSPAPTHVGPQTTADAACSFLSHPRRTPRDAIRGVPPSYRRSGPCGFLGRAFPGPCMAASATATHQHDHFRLQSSVKTDQQSHTTRPMWGCCPPRAFPGQSPPPAPPPPPAATSSLLCRGGGGG